MKAKVLIVSIKPKYAALILSGDKQIELRKALPKVENNDLILIYATAPIKAIVGYCRVKDIIKDSPRKLWHSYGSIAGINRRDFNIYYEQRDFGVGILLKDVRAFKRKLDLDNIREYFPFFNPPQSYAYISLTDISIQLLAKNQGWTINGFPKSLQT